MLYRDPDWDLIGVEKTMAQCLTQFIHSLENPSRIRSYLFHYRRGERRGDATAGATTASVVRRNKMPSIAT